MKSTISSVLAGFLLFFAVTFGAAALSDADIQDIEDVADRWISSLQREDVDGLRGSYWPDAVHIDIHGDGRREIKVGTEEILQGQQELFDSTDVFSQLHYPEPERDLETDPDRPVYLYRMELFGYSDSFTFEKRNGEWRIQEHTLRRLE